jgi:hypothetical protein
VNFVVKIYKDLSTRQFRMTTDWAEANGIESGVTTLFAKDVVIDEANYKMEIPANGAIEVCRNISY